MLNHTTAPSCSISAVTSVLGLSLLAMSEFIFSSHDLSLIGYKLRTYRLSLSLRVFFVQLGQKNYITRRLLSTSITDDTYTLAITVH